MTPIDEILDALRLQSTVFSRMTLSGDWGFEKDPLSGAPFHLLLSGSAWLKEGEAQPLPLLPGDIAVLPRGTRHWLLSRPDAAALRWRRVLEDRNWTHWTPGMRFKTVELHLGSGAPTASLISGVFAFGDHRRNPLLGALPPVLLLRAASGSPAARAAAPVAALLQAELLSGLPGAESVGARLADILFIQAVRHHLSEGGALPRGWLRGMTDPEIAPALALMQRAPERPWSVATLARELGMSRSRFAARFTEIVGQAPLEYLTQWRMYQAAGRMGETRVRLATLAAAAGYRSEVSFSKAFKRWAGCSPARYRRTVLQRGQDAAASADA